jgi:hypothetical protein
MIKTFIYVFFVSILSSCSIYKSKFDCEVPNGATCLSLYEVNQRFDNGEYKKYLDISQLNNCQKTCKMKKENEAKCK